MIWILLRLFAGYVQQILPWAFLCFYPFRGHLRLKNNFHMVLTVFVCTLGILFSGICLVLRAILPAGDILFFSCNLVFFVLLVCCALFYFYIVEESRAKKLFIFSFISMAALCTTSFSNIIFDMANRTEIDFLPYWGINIPINILCTLVIFSFLFYIIKYCYMPVFPIVSEDVCRFLSIVSPVLFLICASGMTFVTFAVSSQGFASTALYVSLLFTIVFMYGMFFRFLQIDQNELLAKAQLFQLDQQLKLNEAQYCKIAENIENSRKMRHDLRHHMLTLQGYLNKNELENARIYIEHYIHVLDQAALHTYSENAIVNYIVSHYHTAARQQNIAFCFPLPKLPRELPIRAADLSVILGNLLDNALTAASKSEKDNRYIKLNILYTAQILVITVDNSFSGEIKKTGDTYISQKSGHLGLGIASITSIAQSYDGGAEFTHEDHVFHASVMLNLENT